MGDNDKQEPLSKLEVLKRYAAGTQFTTALAGFDSQAAVDVPKLVEEYKVLQEWVNDLQSGMYINCVYCGHRYGPDDEVEATMADALKAHIEECPEHPLSKARKVIEAAKVVMDSPHQCTQERFDILAAALGDYDGWSWNWIAPKETCDFPDYEELTAFLAERVESPDGGFPPVSMEDLKALHRLIDAIIDAKWERDVDNDSPISFEVVDRTRYWPMQYKPIPYDRHVKTPADMDHYARMVSINMENALREWEQFQNFFTREWGSSKCLRCGGDAAKPYSDDPCKCGDPIPTTDNRVIEFLEGIKHQRDRLKANQCKHTIVPANDEIVAAGDKGRVYTERHLKEALSQSQDPLMALTAYLHSEQGVELGQVDTREAVKAAIKLLGGNPDDWFKRDETDDEPPPGGNQCHSRGG